LLTVWKGKLIGNFENERRFKAWIRNNRWESELLAIVYDVPVVHSEKIDLLEAERRLLMSHDFLHQIFRIDPSLVEINRGFPLDQCEAAPHFNRAINTTWEVTRREPKWCQRLRQLGFPRTDFHLPTGNDTRNPSRSTPFNSP